LGADPARLSFSGRVGIGRFPGRAGNFSRSLI